MYKFGWTDDEEEFLAECREQVQHGECDCSAGDLECLLDLIDKYKKGKTNVE